MTLQSQSTISDALRGCMTHGEGRFYLECRDCVLASLVGLGQRTTLLEAALTEESRKRKNLEAEVRHLKKRMKQ